MYALIYLKDFKKNFIYIRNLIYNYIKDHKFYIMKNLKDYIVESIEINEDTAVGDAIGQLWGVIGRVFKRFFCPWTKEARDFYRNTIDLTLKATESLDDDINDYINESKIEEIKCENNITIKLQDMSSNKDAMSTLYTQIMKQKQPGILKINNIKNEQLKVKYYVCVVTDGKNELKGLIVPGPQKYVTFLFLMNKDVKFLKVASKEFNSKLKDIAGIIL